MSIPWSDVLTGTGLILNIIGVGALTLTELFTSKPIRMWWFYIWCFDPENPDATNKDPPVEEVSKIGGGLSSDADSESIENYEQNVKIVRNQSIALIGLIGGFTLQFIALFVPN